MAKVLKKQTSYEFLLSDLREKVQRQINEDKLSVREVGRMCELSGATVSRLLSDGEDRSDNLESLMLIADKVGIDFRFRIENRFRK